MDACGNLGGPPTSSVAPLEVVVPMFGADQVDAFGERTQHAEPRQENSALSSGAFGQSSRKIAPAGDWLGPARVIVSRPFEQKEQVQQESRVLTDNQHDDGPQCSFSSYQAESQSSIQQPVQLAQEMLAFAPPPQPPPPNHSVAAPQQQQYHYEYEQKPESLFQQGPYSHQQPVFVPPRPQPSETLLYKSASNALETTSVLHEPNSMARAPESLSPRELVQRGGMLWKIQAKTNALSQSGPKRRWFQVIPLGKNSAELRWHDPEKASKKPRAILLHQVEQVLRGHKTKPFFQLGIDLLPHVDLCFSLVLPERTLDLATNSPQDLCLWLQGLNCFLRPHVRTIESFQTSRDAPFAPMHGLGAPLPELRHAEPTFAVVEQEPSPIALDVVLTELFNACYDNDTAAFEALMDEYEIDIDTIEPDVDRGDSCLIIACKLGHVKIAEICLRYGAKNDPHPSYGQTALQAAVSEGQLVAAKLLLDTAARSGQDVEITNHTDHQGNTSLHKAASRKDLFLMQLLLRHGADTSLLNSHGQTVVHSVVMTRRNLPMNLQQDRLRGLQLLLEHNADDILNVQDKQGNTALHDAVDTGDIALVRTLLESAADPLIPNHSNTTPFHAAKMKKLPQIMSLLHDYQSWYEKPAPSTADASRQPPRRNLIKQKRVNSQPERNPYPQPQTHQRYAQDRGHHHSVPESHGVEEFDQYYTDDGHPYFVSRQTGNSQWEDPRSHSVHAVVHMADEYLYETPDAKIYQASDDLDTDFLEEKVAQQPSQPSVLGQKIRAELYRARQAERQLKAEKDLQLMNGIEVERAPLPVSKSRKKHKKATKIQSNNPFSSDNDSSDASLSSSASGSSRSESSDDDYKTRRRHNSKDKGNRRKGTTSKGQEKSKSKSKRSGKKRRAREGKYVDDRASNQDSGDSGASNSDSDNARQSKHDLSSDTNDAYESAFKRTSSVPQTSGVDSVPQTSGAEQNQDKPKSVESGTSSGQDHQSQKVLELPSEYEKYVKMRQMGVPPMAVREKMLMDGVQDEQAITMVMAVEKNDQKQEGGTSTASSSSSSGFDDATTKAGALKILQKTDSCDKYLKMSKMGLQPMQIRHKMLRDGMPDDLVQLFQKAFGIEEPEMPAQGNSGISAKEAMEKLEANEACQKYLKMKKMGLQPGQIRNKMERDSCDEELLKLFDVAFGLVPPAPSGPAKQSGGKKRQGLVRLHWNTLNVGSKENTVWAKSSESDLPALEGDLAELEQIFAAKKPAAMKSTSSSGAAAKKKRRSTVSSKREGNVSIGLSQFKRKFSDHKDVATAIDCGDLDRIDVAKLELLKEILPSPEEEKAIRMEVDRHGEEKFLGDATNVEKFFMAILAIASPREKIQGMLLVAQFQQLEQDLSKKISMITSACEQIRNSTRLQQIFKLILSIGNFMSGGESQGFTLDSLLKLRDTRGHDATSIIDYLCKLAHKTGGDELLAFDEDLKDIKPASKFVAKEISKEIAQLSTKIRSLGVLVDKNADSKFAQTISPKVEKVNECLGKLQSACESMLESVTQTISYLGESEACTSKHIFSVLSQFVDSFISARQKRDQKIRREARMKAAAEAKKAREQAKAEKEAKMENESKESKVE